MLYTQIIIYNNKINILDDKLDKKKSRRSNIDMIYVPI